MSRSVRICGGIAVAVIVIGVVTDAQDAAKKPAVRRDPTAIILDAFASHSIVALGEGPHGNVQGHRFRLGLIRDPRFASVVNDIVVESGNARYQDHSDRFVQGESVSEAWLGAAHENTVTPTPAWDRPMYEEIFHVVREVNRSLPLERRLRILLGDPPIDWQEVTTPEAYRQWLMQRDSHPAELIQREVVAKGRRALVIYGDGHFQARGERPGRSLAGILESNGTRVFVLTSTFADLSRFQPDVAAWPMPAAAMLAGTLIGSAPYETLFGPPPPIDFFKANPSIEHHFDAVVLLGAASSLQLEAISYPRCAHPDYRRMRVVRMRLAGMPATSAERLSKECAAAAPK